MFYETARLVLGVWWPGTAWSECPYSILGVGGISLTK
jgi:hypothetical protein